MTKNIKKSYKMLTDEDLKIIKSDPAGLADYVVRSKVKEARKTATILAIIAVVLAFGAGVLSGMVLTQSSIPNNVVQIQVGEGQTAEPVKTEGK